MGSIIQTANSHQTSLLVAEQVPDFIRSDHPKFVTFVEKYYEFLANNTLMQTPDGSGNTYFGADSGLKSIQDIGDIDTTDLDNFLESFRRQYGPALSQTIYSSADTRLLYKNLVNFYRAVGTEDSFKMLFRLLYNEDVEIYYPKVDMLIASGGNYTKLSRIQVKYVENINDMANKKVIGATSGAYGTVEKVQVFPQETDKFVSGQIAKTSSPYYSRQSGNTAILSGRSNTEIYDPIRYVEKFDQTAFIYLTAQSGTFDFF